MKNPCVKNCPERSAECKLICPRFKDYEKEKFKQYKENEKERELAENYYYFEKEQRKKRVRR